MQDWLKAATAAVAADAPMVAQTVPVVPNRRLHLDGDMLAYWAGGNNETSPAVSRQIALGKIDAMQYAAGAESTVVHLTARSSHKGQRFIIATVKPYQGQRKSGRKPRNWEFLRTLMEGGESFPHRTKLWATREADDGFALVAGPDAVLATKDKDMRMITNCWHMLWDSMEMVWVPPDTFALEANGLLYGHKWFWQQMLQGDTADNIPGLPEYYGKQCGEMTAVRALADTACNADAYDVVATAYEVHYADEWKARMLEQALLLWLRPGQAAHISDVLQMLPADVFSDELAAVEQRIKEVYAEADAIQGAAVQSADAG